MPKQSRSDEQRRFDQRVGLRVRELRQRAGISQETLALAIGLNQAQIYRIERGLATCTLWTAAMLGLYFDVPWQEILSVQAIVLLRDFSTVIR